MSLHAEIAQKVTDMVEAADTGSMASRALMGRRDASPELMELLTQLRGYFVEVRAAAYELKKLIGAANMVGEDLGTKTTGTGAPRLMELSLMDLHSRPPRHGPLLDRRMAAAGE
jgi:hypothetical protein